MVLGFDTVPEYEANPAYFGCATSRVANRIAGGRFELDGRVVQLAVNAPPNHIHGGEGGFHRALWRGDPEDAPEGPGVRFRRVSPGGEDGHAGYKGLSNHKVVQHNIGEWVNQNSHTNGIESVWAMFSRGFHGTYHRMSIQHLHRYAQEFQGRHNERDEDTIVQMEKLVEGFAGERLTYKDLIALKGDAIPVVTIEVGGGEDWLPDFDKALAEWETFLKARAETARQSSTRHSSKRAASAAAAKTLVGHRLKRSGMRWTRQGGQQILNLRVHVQSQRWEAFWNWYLHQTTQQTDKTAA